MVKKEKYYCNEKPPLVLGAANDFNDDGDDVLNVHLFLRVLRLQG